MVVASFAMNRRFKKKNEKRFFTVSQSFVWLLNRKPAVNVCSFSIQPNVWIQMTFSICQAVDCMLTCDVHDFDVSMNTLWLCVYVYLAFEWPNCSQQEKHTKFHNKQITVNFASVYPFITAERCIQCPCSANVFWFHLLTNRIQRCSARCGELHWTKTENKHWHRIDDVRLM